MLTPDMETILMENGVGVVSIFTPRDAGKWRVTLREGPAWVVGDTADTLHEALDSALRGFRKDWSDKRGKVQPAAAAVDDELERLLG